MAAVGRDANGLSGRPSKVCHQFSCTTLRPDLGQMRSLVGRQADDQKSPGDTYKEDQRAPKVEPTVGRLPGYHSCLQAIRRRARAPNEEHHCCNREYSSFEKVIHVPARCSCRIGKRVPQALPINAEFIAVSPMAGSPKTYHALVTALGRSFTLANHAWMFLFSGFSG